MVKQDCVHYWKIEPANGVESEGLCARCGLRRTFVNRLRDPHGKMTDWKRGVDTDG